MSARDTAQHRADVIKGRRIAEAMLADALADYEEDTGRAAVDDVWRDLVVATAQGILAEAGSIPYAQDVAKEFLRSELGGIPFELRALLGEL